MRKWSPIREGIFSADALCEPETWVCDDARGGDCHCAGLYHGAALVDCDLFNVMVPSPPPLRSMRLLDNRELAAVVSMMATIKRVAWRVPTADPTIATDLLNDGSHGGVLDHCSVACRATPGRCWCGCHLTPQASILACNPHIMFTALEVKRR